MTFTNGYSFCGSHPWWYAELGRRGRQLYYPPSLIFTGVLPIEANATSTVALWPGTVASMGAYRRELVKQKRSLVILLSITSLIGGILGAELLLNTSQATFIRLLPYLLLLATVLFALSGPVCRRCARRRAAEARWPHPSSFPSLASPVRSSPCRIFRRRDRHPDAGDAWIDGYRMISK